MLAGRFVELVELDSISPATIGRRLQEKDIKPWQKKMWCIPEVNADFVAHMEDVLELYAQPSDPLRPVVCIDETLKQLVEDVKAPLPPLTGSREKVDDHYRRNGTANLFMFVDRHGAAFTLRIKALLLRNARTIPTLNTPKARRAIHDRASPLSNRCCRW